MVSHSSINRVVAHFRSWRQQGLGDLETMLAGIRYRMEHNGAKLDPPARPPGYRSERLRQRLKELGATKTTLWGPTAIRGDLAADKKKHIIDFLKLVNDLPGDPQILLEAFDKCAAIYVEKTREKYPPIVLPAESTIQRRLFAALRQGGKGKIQQGLMYALLQTERQLVGAGYEVRTKRTHAGDWQSGHKGDVQIVWSDEIVSVYEVKGVPLTQAEMHRVLGTHGKHFYPLFVLAPAYAPPELKEALNSLENTFAANIEDFVVTKLSDILSSNQIQPEELLRAIIDTYNRVFCQQLENDPSIMISI